jgi:hypothetical protein
MRLGQLARKLSLRTGDIVEFLATNNIQIGEGSNTRIDDEHAMLAIKHFAPGMEMLLKEEEAEHQINLPTAEMPEVVIEDVKAIETESIIDEVVSVEGTEASEATEESSDVVTEEPALIKAQKVELPGLKVIGKIDLPEPKKKEIPTAETEEGSVSINSDTSTELPKRKQREDRRPFEKRERNDRPRKNPVALQREREALEDEKKKRAEAELAKERRTNNYLKKVKPTQPVRAAKLMAEEYVALEPEEKKPDSWFGRLIHWLKGKG